MNKLHITQDDYGFWMLSYEQEDGTLSLVAHQFADPEHLIEHANELVRERNLNAVVMIEPPRTAPTREATAAEGYSKPEPRRAGE